ncbi:rhomboid family intramembrane serine protease [Cupriavidus basilensis]
MLAGEAWRLLSCHFVHLGWAHCLLNVAGLLMLAAILPARVRAWHVVPPLATMTGLLLVAGEAGAAPLCGVLRHQLRPCHACPAATGPLRWPRGDAVAGAGRPRELADAGGPRRGCRRVAGWPGRGQRPRLRPGRRGTAGQVRPEGASGG